MKNIFCFFIFLFIFTACSQNKLDEKIYTETKLYNQGMSMFNSGKFKEALKKFQSLSTMYPFSYLGMKSQVRSAEINYKIQKYEDAANNCSLYLQYYPNGEDIIYMHYLKAISNYNKVREISKNSEALIQAQGGFEALIEKYPDSKYADRARIKLKQVADNLAQKELLIAKFYFNRGEYVAALSRLNNLINSYPGTKYYPPALFGLIKLYVNIGMLEQADYYYQLLAKNYPSSLWHQYAQKELFNTYKSNR